MNFSEALEHIKQGGNARRSCWGDKVSDAIRFDSRYAGHQSLVYSGAECFSGTLCIWEPSQAAILADDWEMVAIKDGRWVVVELTNKEQ